MASGDYDTKITIGMESDLSGGVQTEKQLDQLKRKAREFGKEGESALGQVQQAAGKLQKGIGFLRSALTGFGAVGAIMGLVGAIGKIRDSFKTATKEAEELARAKEKTERREEIEKLAKSYEALGRAISKSAESLRRANELQDIALKNARELENAQLDLAEQKELAAVDASDPAAAEKRAAISARYNSQRGALASKRSREDIATEFNRLNAEAANKRTAAGKITSSLAEDDRLIEKLQQKLEEAERKSIQRNARDLPAESALHDVKNFFTGNWGDVVSGKRTTAEGDAVRKIAADQAEGLKAELKSLRESREVKQREAETLRSEAEHLEERAGAVYGGLQAADVRETASAVANQTAVDTAADSLAKKKRAIAKDQATIAQGPGRIAAIEGQIAATEAQQRAAKQADAKEQMDAILAQQALDSFSSAGHRRNGTGVQKQRSALEADVERETREATQSRAQLQSTLATLAATLKGLNADLNKVKREVDAATKRQAAVNDEAPEG